MLIWVAILHLCCFAIFLHWVEDAPVIEDGEVLGAHDAGRGVRAAKVPPLAAFERDAA